MQMPDVGSLLLVVIMLGLLPFAAMVVTSYTKIVVVLGLLRNAIGVQQVPPNMVLNGVALLVSCFVMAPVGMEAFKAAQNYSPGAGTRRSSGLSVSALSLGQICCAERMKKAFSRSRVCLSRNCRNGSRQASSNTTTRLLSAPGL